ncbi:MAG TPA: alginate export family protein [Gemmatimonadaceae bacterium]|nr:alginate export family protein [Gemmatimonadaceae bacterium]
MLAAVPALGAAQTAAVTAGKVAATTSSPNAVLPWGSIGGQIRVRAESYSGGGFQPDNSDAYLLTRILLNARVRPTASTSLFVEGMDARGPWKNKTPVGAPFRDHADLRQLYAQIGADKAPTFLRAGRQELFYGDGRLVGPLLWANTARTFDAARLSTGGKGYRIDAFAASVVKVEQDRFDKNIPGNNFYGTYAAITSLVPRASVEPFFFWRRQSGLLNEAGVRGTMNFGTLGLRLAGKPDALDYDAQLVGQHGSLGDESIRAWAAHALLGYTASRTPLTPRVWAEYNQATGDANPTDNRKETFDQLYPTGHDKYGLTDLVGWQNMRHVRAGLDVAFNKAWSATTRYSHYWLDDPHDALYNGGGAPLARSPTGAAGTNVGQEIDLVASRKLRPGFGFSAGIGHFMPGSFLKTTTPGQAYTYPYAMVTWDF